MFSKSEQGHSGPLILPTKSLVYAALFELLFDVGFNFVRGSDVILGYVGLCGGLTLAMIPAILLVERLFCAPPTRLALPIWAAAHGSIIRGDLIVQFLAGSVFAIATWTLLPGRRRSRLRPIDLASVLASALCIALLVAPDAVSVMGSALDFSGVRSLSPLLLFIFVLGLARAYLMINPTLRLPSLATLSSLLLIGSLVAVAVVVQRTRIEISDFDPYDDVTGASYPNVFLLVLDTVRADHLSVYGYERKTTPEIARLVERFPNSRIYEFAFSPSNWTAPSHASLLTGMMPSHHGVQSAKAGRMLYSKVASSPLQAKQTLAEVLKDSGYQTAAVVANAFLLRVEGLERGFDLFVQPNAVRSLSMLGERLRSWLAKDAFGSRIKPYPSAKAIIRRSRDFLARCEQGPCFLLANFMEAHSPYLAQSPYAGAFAGDRRMQPLRDAFMTDSEEEVSLKLDRYDEEILGLDAQLGGFFSALEESDQIDDAWLIITSDHGEAFAEHGSSSHGSSIYNEQVRIPLIIKPPLGESLAKIEGPVTLLDIATTIAAIAGKASFGRGRDLRVAIEEERPVRVEFYGALRKKLVKFGESAGNSAQAVINNEYKLITTTRGDELYEIHNDPGEVNDLSEQNPAVIADLATHLGSLEVPEGLDKDLGEPRRSTVDEGALRALGYID